MSDQDLGKKLVEEMDFEPLPDEYYRVTGLRLDLRARGERPDFLCSRSDGAKLGLELTKVMVDPESRFWLRTLKGEQYVDPVDTAVRLQEAVYRKDAKRALPDWNLPDRTVLVLQLMDTPIAEVAPHLDKQLLDEMSTTGFLEIWVADYTVRKAFATVQLFGIKPGKWRGLHPHAWEGTKPYG